MARKPQPTRADLERQIFELTEMIKKDAELDKFRAETQKIQLSNLDRLLTLLETQYKTPAKTTSSMCDGCKYQKRCTFFNGNFTYCPKTAAPASPVVAIDALSEKGFFYVTLH